MPLIFFYVHLAILPLIFFDVHLVVFNAKGTLPDDLLLSELPKIRPTGANKISDYFHGSELRNGAPMSARPLEPATTIKTGKRTRVMILPEAQKWIVARARKFYDGHDVAPQGTWYDDILEEGIRLRYLTTNHNPQGLRSLVRRIFECDDIKG